MNSRLPAMRAARLISLAVASGALQTDVLGHGAVKQVGLLARHSRWPAAMVAPTPVSALLHAVAVVKAGVFSLLKVVVYAASASTLLGATILTPRFSRE